MTEELFRQDSYIKECDATVVAVDGSAVILDRTVFYPMGGGQPGDTGELSWDGGGAAVIDTRYGDEGSLRHTLAEGAAVPAVGENVHAVLDWARRIVADTRGMRQEIEALRGGLSGHLTLGAIPTALP